MTIEEVRKERPPFVAAHAGAEFHIYDYEPAGLIFAKAAVRPYGGDEKIFFVAWEDIRESVTAPVGVVQLPPPVSY